MHTTKEEMISKRRGKAIEWILGIIILVSILALGLIIHLSRLEPRDHRNLRYLMWKAGMRNYDKNEVLEGIFHDHTFQRSLNGMSLSEFHRMFPASFHPISSAAPESTSGDVRLTSDPCGTTSPFPLIPEGYVAHFRGGKLVSFDYHKGVP
jgi:hypothetical protein